MHVTPGLYRCTLCGWYYLRDAQDRYSTAVFFANGLRTYELTPIRWYSRDEHGAGYPDCIQSLERV